MEQINKKIRVHADSYYQFIKNEKSRTVFTDGFEKDGPDYYILNCYVPVWPETTMDEIVGHWVEFIIKLAKYGAI